MSVAEGKGGKKEEGGEDRRTGERERMETFGDIAIDLVQHQQ